MEEVLQKIDTMTEAELRIVMEAVEQRYREAYPEWDVVYMAMHKDPVLRKQEFINLLEFIGKDMQWSKEQNAQ